MNDRRRSSVSSWPWRLASPNREHYRRRVEEARLERVVEAALRERPYFALEPSSLLGEADRAVAEAVVRLDAAGRVTIPEPGDRFELVR